MDINGQEFRFCAATIGNPHCVVLRDEVFADEVQKLGPLVENDPRFPNRTNVQFMKILDRNNIKIEIWERGQVIPLPLEAVVVQQRLLLTGWVSATLK